MRWLEEFRDPSLAPALVARIREGAKGLPRMTFMEVCGTHTMSIARAGIREVLPPNVRLVSGPGCPVCVTPIDFIDHAVALARRPRTVIATFGDLVRVPGSTRSLAQESAAGAKVRVVSGSLEALRIAQATPDVEVVFLAVGFETTAPTTAATLLAARAAGTKSFSILCAHRRVPPALDFLGSQPDLALDGLLCPPHVSAITGTRIYEPLVAKGVGCVVAGFEPLDILYSVALLIEQRAAKTARLQNEYSRVVLAPGNARALAVLDEVFEPCASTWRGLGTMAGSGLRLRPAFAAFDAARHAVEVEPPQEPAGCICGKILTGAREPEDCPLFGRGCTPDHPVGACMVSSEGTCAARYRYRGRS